MSRKNISISVNNKVFSEDDINDLIEIFGSLYTKHDEPDEGRIWKSQKLSISIDSYDKIGEDFDETDYKLAKKILKAKKITSFSASFSDNETNSLLSVKLDENEYSTTTFTLYSQDTEWFNARRTQIQDYMTQVADQDNFYLKHKKAIRRISAFLAGIPVIALVYLGMIIWTQIFPTQPSTEQFTPLQRNVAVSVLLFFAIIFNYLIGSLLTDKFFDRIDSLFPKIEFNFGPKRLNPRLKKRTLAKHLLLILVLPLFIDMIFFLVALF